MGGGDLNMKKSWHPLLQVNQEKVWKREQEAAEERKKLEELRREREQEREMQELQRLQEEAGGKKRIDRVDWMYATPAANTGSSSAELEDYLLGKKRVDKLLQADDTPAVSKSDQSNFISMQNANSTRDLAAKVREDPMLAIKQQEQAAYEALLRDPVRLRQMKRKAGIESEGADVNRESREERRRRKDERRRRHDEARHHQRRARVEDDDQRGKHTSKSDRHSGEEGSSSRAHTQYHEERRRRSGSHEDTWRDEDSHSSKRSNHSQRDSEFRYPNSRRSGAEHRDRRTRTMYDQDRSPLRSPRLYARSSREADNLNSSTPTSDLTSLHRNNLDRHRQTDREARLREMTQNAASLQTERKTFVTRIDTEDAEQEQREAQLRQKLIAARKKGHSDGRGTFLIDQQRQAFGEHVDLADRLKRGRQHESFQT